VYYVCPLLFFSFFIFRGGGCGWMMDVRDNNIASVQRVGDSVRSSLGPGAKSKMVVKPSGEVIVTSDGARIVSEVCESLVATTLRSVEHYRVLDEEYDPMRRMAKTTPVSRSGTNSSSRFKDDHLRREMAQLDPLAAFKARSNSTSSLKSLSDQLQIRMQHPAARMLVDASLKQKGTLVCGVVRQLYDEQRRANNSTMTIKMHLETGQHL